MQALAAFANTLLFGKPVLLYIGMLAGIFFLLAILFGILARKGKADIKIHLSFVKITLAIAAVHFILAASIYL